MFHVFQRDRAVCTLKTEVKNVNRMRTGYQGRGSREHWYIHITDNVDSLSLMAK